MQNKLCSVSHPCLCVLLHAVLTFENTKVGTGSSLKYVSDKVECLLYALCMVFMAFTTISYIKINHPLCELYKQIVLDNKQII